jgi:hypothetical protein
LEYEGGGIGEYQFWDRFENKWDTTACDYESRVNKKNNNNNKNNNNGGTARCAKMDCHLEDTHFSLLGFFKHKQYDEWMGQLFKHQGVCVWTDDEYSFMKDAKDAWPDGCTLSDTVTDSGSPIYYAVKPVRRGGITLGLYTDTRCVKEYQSQGSNDPINIENVIGNLLAEGGSGDHSGDKNNNNVEYSTWSESLDAWDSAFSIFKQCQPCIAYDLNNYGYEVNDDNYRGSSYGTYRYGFDDDYAWNYYYSKKNMGDDFDCYDDAGYTNVNQVRYCDCVVETSVLHPIFCKRSQSYSHSFFFSFSLLPAVHEVHGQDGDENGNLSRFGSGDVTRDTCGHSTGRVLCRIKSKERRCWDVLVSCRFRRGASLRGTQVSQSSAANANCPNKHLEPQGAACYDLD